MPYTRFGSLRGVAPPIVYISDPLLRLVSYELAITGGKFEFNTQLYIVKFSESSLAQCLSYRRLNSFPLGGIWGLQESWSCIQLKVFVRWLLCVILRLGFFAIACRRHIRCQGHGSRSVMWRTVIMPQCFAVLSSVIVSYTCTVQINLS